MPTRTLEIARGGAFGGSAAFLSPLTAAGADRAFPNNARGDSGALVHRWPFSGAADAVADAAGGQHTFR
jgi:hypothetical protein